MDAELAFDELGHSSPGPKFGGEPEGLGVLAKPEQDSPLPSRRQLGRPSGVGVEAIPADPCCWKAFHHLRTDAGWTPKTSATWAGVLPP